MGIRSTKFTPREEDYSPVMCRCEGFATYRCECEKMADSYPELEQFWASSCGTTKQYIACDFCITDKASKLMTHHPTGWKEHYKCFIHYEKLITPSQKLV